MNNSSADVAQREAKVTVIVPTMARPERRLQLQRAIYSIRASSAEPIWIIVVVNGTQFDVSVCAWLREQTDVQLEMLSTPSAPGAVLRGRELVRTEFFSTLDDDDEYLPRSTDLKICALLNNKDADLLVANLYTHTEGVDELTYDRLLEVPANPLGCLMKFAWLHNGNALYRTKSVDVAYFKDFHSYVEWTWLAFRLSLDGKIVAVLDQPVFRYYDTALSLSKSEAYLKAHFSLFRRMLECSPPRHIVQMIHRKTSASHHDASVAALAAGRRAEAWNHHWKSLRKACGLRYLSYTRRLFL